MPSTETTQQAIDTALEAAASQPAKMSGDAGSVEQRSVSDLIALDKHVASKAAGKRGAPFGMRFGRIVPPGANG